MTRQEIYSEAAKLLGKVPGFIETAKGPQLGGWNVGVVIASLALDRPGFGYPFPDGCRSDAIIATAQFFIRYRGDFDVKINAI